MATTSQFFAIKRVEIRGTDHLSREEVLKAAETCRSGVNSLTVNIADVEQGLREQPVGAVRGREAPPAGCV